MQILHPDQLLAPVRQQAERIMHITLVVLFCCGLMVASLTNSWGIAFGIGLPALIIPVLISRLQPASLASRLSIAAAFMIFSAQFIQQSHGMSEAHFMIFVLLAFLLYFRDWKPIVAAAGLIAVHHLLFNQLQANQTGIQIFREGSGLPIVLLHALFVVFETAVLVYMAVRQRNEAIESALVAKLAQEIANGKLQTDLAIDTTPYPLLHAVIDMQQQLANTFSAIRDQSVTVSRAMTTLSSHSQQVSYNMSQQHQSANQMHNNIQSLTSTVNELANEATDASQLAKHSGESARAGATVVKAAVNEMVSIAETIRHSADNVERLGAQSDRVVQVVSLIKEIADQTNLLALNAAIEAARAGEQGRGFAVVADEVRKLSERTSQATQDIGKMMSEIVESKTATLTSIDEAVNRVDRGVQLATEAGQSIDAITSAAHDVQATIARISSTLTNQQQFTIAIADQVETVTRMASESNDAASSNLQLGEELDRVGARLSEAISRFKI